MPQIRPPALENAISEDLTPLGKVETRKGRLIVLPNSHVHKVSEMVKRVIDDDETNKDTQVAKRLIA